MVFPPSKSEDISMTSNSIPLHQTPLSPLPSSVLLRYGCNVEARTNDGTNPLLLALNRDHLEPCYLLLLAGCDPRPLVHMLGLSPDPELDAEVIAEYVQKRQNSGPGNHRFDASPDQFQGEITKLCNFVRKRVFESPLSLKDSSKFVVRRALRTDIERKAEKLPLPAPLRKVIVNIFDNDEDDVGKDESQLRESAAVGVE